MPEYLGSNIRKVADKLKELNYGHVIYDYNKKENDFIEKLNVDGNENEEKKLNVGCDNCLNRSYI